MTRIEFREIAMALKDKALDPEDKHDLQTALKNVSTYRVVGQVDIDTATRLKAKYLNGDAD